MLVLSLPAFGNKKYTAYDRFHGNGPYGEIPTKNEPIRTLGLALPYNNSEKSSLKLNVLPINPNLLSLVLLRTGREVSNFAHVLNVRTHCVPTFDFGLIK